MLSHPLSKLPTSRPADWGHTMSVCIAALCERRSIVVTACDMLATLGSTASDVAVFKNEVLFPRWAILTAGEDTEHIDPIVRRARQLLSRKYQHKSPEQVAEKLTQAYQEGIQAQIGAKVLAKYGFTPRTFHDQGKKKLTASVYNMLAAKIALITIRLQFLVAGMGTDKKGHIVGLMGEEAPVSYDKLGYWAIGQGAPMALASLGFFNRQFRLSGHSSIGECVYQVLAAKFMSEVTKTVGNRTFVAIYGPGEGEARFISMADQQRIKDAWEEEGAPRIPSKIVQQIPGMILSYAGDPANDPQRQKELADWAEMLRIRPWLNRT
jgi:hypothetical protein